MQTSVRPPLDYAAPVIRSDATTRAGLAFGLGAYLSWGVVPIYFKMLTHVPALHVLAHRIVWSAIFLGIIVLLRGGWREIRTALRRRDVLLALSASTLLIAVNWYTFIYAIEQDQLLQASLGYYINPLVSVLLGVIFLRERLRGWQLVAVALAAAGVVNLTIYQQQFPWIAVVLAISFGFYGLLRKVMHIGAMAGLTVETWILFLPSMGVLAWTWSHEAAASYDTGTHVLLGLAGVVTALPLLMFAAAARRLRLSTMGFLQYLAPTSQFLLAVLLYNEPFTRVHLVTFALIWAAVVVYTSDSYLGYRKRALLPAQARDERANPPT